MLRVNPRFRRSSERNRTVAAAGRVVLRPVEGAVAGRAGRFCAAIRAPTPQDIWIIFEVMIQEPKNASVLPFRDAGNLGRWDSFSKAVFLGRGTPAFWVIQLVPAGWSRWGSAVTKSKVVSWDVCP